MAVSQDILRLERQWELNPKDLRVLRELVVAHQRIGRVKEARLWCLRMVGAAPESLEAQSLLAVTFPEDLLQRTKSGDHADAIEELVRLTDCGRAEAEDFLRQLKRADAVANLIANLKDRAFTDPRYAGRCVAELANAGRQALPKLVQLLLDRAVKSDVRWRAAQALQSMYPGPVEAIPALRVALMDESSWVRGFAAKVLAAIGPNAVDAVPELIEVLGRGEAFDRTSVANALGAMGPEAAGAVPALASALGDQDTILRQRAAWALGRIGPSAGAAIRQLRDCLAASDANLRAEAEQALMRIQEQE